MIEGAYIVSGLFVGILVGLTGVGGGSLMTPFLTLVFGISPSIAVGTDLAFAATTKLFGTAAHKKVGSIQWKIVRCLLFGAIPATLISSAIIYTFGKNIGNYQSYIRIAISIALFLTAASMLLRDQLRRLIAESKSTPVSERKKFILTVAFGFIVGTLVTFSSIGAGAIAAALLVILYPHLTASEIAGTDIAYAAPVTLIAAFGHGAVGNIDYSLLVSLLIGSIPGIFIGSLGTKWFPERLLRKTLAFTLLAVAAKTALS